MCTDISQTNPEDEISNVHYPMASVLRQLSLGCFESVLGYELLGSWAKGSPLTCPGALSALDSTPPSFASINIQQYLTLVNHTINNTSSFTSNNDPWILFSKGSMNHSKMQSLRPLMSYKFSLRREAAKRRPSHPGLLTSFNTTDTDHGTSFVLHSLSRVRGR